MDITIPFPGRSFIDVTREMLEQGYTPQIMFQIAEGKFYIYPLHRIVHVCLKLTIFLFQQKTIRQNRVLSFNQHDGTTN